MRPFTTLTAIAAPIDEANIDTNQLCPTRFNKVPRGPGHAPAFPERVTVPAGTPVGTARLVADDTAALFGGWIIHWAVSLVAFLSLFTLVYLTAFEPGHSH